MQIRFFTLLLVTTFLAGCSPSKQALTVEATNPGATNRTNEMIELPWEAVQQKLSLSEGETIVVTDGNGQQVPYQRITTTETLIFPVSAGAGETAVYRISAGKPKPFAPLVYGRLVPERKDDFAWENNRSAFRVYGPALKATGEISNGMDFWAKKTEVLIIDKWYKDDLAGVASYHEDHGEGLDFYNVGRTLGLGMTAPVYDGALCLGDNFVAAEVLDNGPLRITFKLSYAPYKAGEREITETRIISLDAYSLFNKVTHLFETDAAELTVATGIVMAKNKPEITYGANGIIAYETPGDGVNGIVYTAAVHPGGFNEIATAQGHLLGLNDYRPGAPYTCYVGGGWNRAGFDDFDAWIDLVKEVKATIDQPLTIHIR
jgi:hypothetical protein